MSTTAFGAMIRRHRRRIGLTQEELAEAAALSPRGLIYLERGERRPHPGTAVRLADALQLANGERTAFLLAFEQGDSDTPTDAVPSDTWFAVRAHALGSLPAQPTLFIGRDEEIRGLVELLREIAVRLATLTGPGGSGKTRLAIAVAALLEKEYADGICFVALASTSDPALVLTTIAGALGIREMPDQSALTTLSAYLREKQLLLVLDNFEQVLPAAAEIGGLLATCPLLTVLVTSRFVLNVYGEHEFPVPPFEVPEAESASLLGELTRYDAPRLFIQRARMVRPDFSMTNDNAQAVLTICRRLDGLPLAIELAAARVKVLPPEGLLARMDDRLTLLTGGSRDLPARQRTLRDTIAWSHDLLDATEQVLFRRLAVFVGGCTLEAAEEVCDPHNDLDINVLDVLASLVDKNLLRQAHSVGPGGSAVPRFSMLETIREFALERMQKSGEADELGRIHAEYYRDLAERWFFGTLSAERGPVLDMVSLELDNIRAALRWSIDHRRPEIGMPIVGWLWLWYLHMAPLEGLRIEQELLAMPEAQDRSATRAWGLVGAAASAWAAGLVQLSTQFSAEALTLARELGDTDELMAAALVSIAGRSPDSSSIEYAREARDICREHISRPGLSAVQVAGWKMAFALSSWQPAFTLPYHGDVATVTAWLDDALAIGRETDDGWAQAVVIMFQGFMMAGAGNLDAARALLTQSAALYRATPDKLNFAAVLVALGGLSLLQGNVDAAAEQLQEGLDLSRELNDPGNIAACLEGIAGVALAHGQVEEAVRLLGSARALRDATGAVALPTSDALNAGIVGAIRSALDEASFERAFAEGAALTVDQAIEHALEHTPATVP